MLFNKGLKAGTKVRVHFYGGPCLLGDELFEAEIKICAHVSHGFVLDLLRQSIERKASFVNVLWEAENNLLVSLGILDKVLKLDLFPRSSRLVDKPSYGNYGGK